MILLDQGQHNHSSGPDFHEARIRMEGTTWVGSVEIHLRSSDWYVHGHQTDPNYDNVILHVVLEYDSDVLDTRGKPIPTIVLKSRISMVLIQRHDALLNDQHKIPCEPYLSQVPSLTLSSWLTRMAVDRLDQKIKDIQLIHDYTGQDWLETFYQLIAGYLGGPFNRAPLQELCRKIPLKVMLRISEREDRLALLLGTAGFLMDSNEHWDDYSQALRSTYQHLTHKLDIPIIQARWKNGRVRPLEHPIRRIVQLSSLSFQVPELYNMSLTESSVNWNSIDIQADSYWLHHYTFAKASSTELPMRISKELGDRLNINAVIPFVFYYGRSTGDEALANQSIEALEQISPENIAIVNRYSKQGFPNHSALDSQGILNLQKNYCSHKKCVLCNVGRSIIAGS